MAVALLSSVAQDLSFSFEESFSHDDNFAFAVDLYQPWDPHLTQARTHTR